MGGNIKKNSERDSHLDFERFSKTMLLSKCVLLVIFKKPIRQLQQTTEKRQPDDYKRFNP